jgi:hypothetical protein
VVLFGWASATLAAHHVYEQPRFTVAHTAREVLLPCDVIELLADDVGAVGEQPVGQCPVQRLAVFGQPAVLLGQPATVRLAVR